MTSTASFVPRRASVAWQASTATGQMLRAWNYIRMHGPELRDVTDMAVLNANVRAQLRGTYRIPTTSCASTRSSCSPQGKKALDIAKGLIDYGYHPPDLLPTRRQGGDADRAYRDGVQRDPRRLYRTMLELAETSQEDLEEPRRTPRRAASTRPAPPGNSRPGGRGGRPPGTPRSTRSTRTSEPGSWTSPATRCPCSTRAYRPSTTRFATTPGCSTSRTWARPIFRGPDAERAVQRLVTRDVVGWTSGRPATRRSATKTGGRWTM